MHIGCRIRYRLHVCRNSNNNLNCSIMKPGTRELIKAERRRDLLSYITETIQRGRIKPAKFRHYFRMPVSVYESFRMNEVISSDWMNGHFINETLFIEYREEIVTLNFVNKTDRSDFAIRIYSAMLQKEYGFDPFKMGGSAF